MSKFVRKDIDNLNAQLSITIEKSDYVPKVKTELDKIRKKAQMKGFRKGKTPFGLVKKLYGKTVLSEVINEVLNKELVGYITEEKLDILGQPLPSSEQEELDFDVNNLEDLEFIFDLGLSPVFEVQGVDKETAYEYYAVQPDPEKISGDLAEAQRRLGKQEASEEPIELEDIVEINAEELEGGEIKENGWATTFKIAVKDIAEEAVRNQFLGKQKGDKLRFDIYKLEGDKPEEYVKKYLLQVTENDTQEIGADFEGVIAGVTRLVPAELNQDFFDRYFGEGEVKSEEEAREKIEADYRRFYEQQADAILFRDFRQKLIEANQLELPDAFLKRWLLQTSKENTVELIEEQYDDFAKDLRWSLIRNKLAERFELEVTEEDLRNEFREKVRGYYGNYLDESLVEQTVDRLMQDKENVQKTSEEILGTKMLYAVKESVNLVEKPIAAEEFEQVITKIREEEAQKRKRKSEEEE